MADVHGCVWSSVVKNQQVLRIKVVRSLLPKCVVTSDYLLLLLAVISSCIRQSSRTSATATARTARSLHPAFASRFYAASSLSSSHHHHHLILLLLLLHSTFTQE